MSELAYYVASTIDGFIAQSNGSFEGFAWDDEVVFDFISDQKKFDVVLMGRKTYEVGLKEGKTSPYPSMRQVVFCKSMSQSPDEAVALVDDNPVSFVKGLKAEGNHQIWLCGGSQLATPLLEAGLIDKVVIKLNLVIFGSGVPVFGELTKFCSLSLQETKTYECGIVFLTYGVVQRSLGYESLS